MGVPCGVAAVKELRRLGFELREQQWSHRVARCKPNDASLEERMDLASFTDPTKVVEDRLDSFVVGTLFERAWHALNSYLMAWLLWQAET
jgi:hypothetical protein